MGFRPYPEVTVIDRVKNAVVETLPLEGSDVGGGPLYVTRVVRGSSVVTVDVSRSVDDALSLHDRVLALAKRGIL